MDSARAVVIGGGNLVIYLRQVFFNRVRHRRFPLCGRIGSTVSLIDQFHHDLCVGIKAQVYPRRHGPARRLTYLQHAADHAGADRVSRCRRLDHLPGPRLYMASRLSAATFRSLLSLASSHRVHSLEFDVRGCHVHLDFPTVARFVHPQPLGLQADGFEAGSRREGIRRAGVDEKQSLPGPRRFRRVADGDRDVYGAHAGVSSSLFHGASWMMGAAVPAVRNAPESTARTFRQQFGPGRAPELRRIVRRPNRPRPRPGTAGRMRRPRRLPLHGPGAWLQEPRAPAGRCYNHARLPAARIGV